MRFLFRKNIIDNINRKTGPCTLRTNVPDFPVFKIRIEKSIKSCKQNRAHNKGHGVFLEGQPEEGYD
ncbi:MAG: hypothetical protein WC919_06910, partial [Candidatus Paceibacterota bacterium]